MLKFKKLEKDLSQIKEYIKEYGGAFCDLSLGVRFTWGSECAVEYAEYNNTLILKEISDYHEEAFYYPLGDDQDGALTEIETYCIKNAKQLCFCCVEDAIIERLTERYDSVSISFERDWCDYVYLAEQFRTYAGKKLSGRRNHVNKFKKLYPNYEFKKITEQDKPRIKEFLAEYNSRGSSGHFTEQKEREKVFELLDNSAELDQLAGYVQVDGKIIAFSMGERIKDTLIVHVEKALTEYDGVYPLMAQEFVKAFGDGATYVNREEDCGDQGLRTSKLQYRPIEIKKKNFVVVHTLFDKIKCPVEIKTERLIVNDITEQDKTDYFALSINERINEWWGYDYKDGLKGKQPDADYFYNFQNGLKQRKEEYPLAVRHDGEFIGEVTMHNFDHFGGLEIGFRFFESAQNKGYALESVSALMDYAKNTLKAKKIKVCCYKQNLRSNKLIEKLGFLQINQDGEKYYFEKLLTNNI